LTQKPWGSSPRYDKTLYKPKSQEQSSGLQKGVGEMEELGGYRANRRREQKVNKTKQN